MLIYNVLNSVGTISYFFPTLMTSLGYRGRPAQCRCSHQDLIRTDDTISHDSPDLRCRPHHRSCRRMERRSNPSESMARRGRRRGISHQLHHLRDGQEQRRQVSLALPYSLPSD